MMESSFSGQWIVVTHITFRNNLFRILIRTALIYFSFCLTALGQSGSAKPARFASEGLTFEYPATWILTNKSNSEVQHLVMTSDSANALVMVIADRDLISFPEYLTAGRRNSTEPLITETIAKLASHTAEREPVRIKVNQIEADGTRLRGRFKNELVTAEIYSFADRGRFVNLFYIRSDKDAIKAAAGLMMIVKTLSVDGPEVSHDQILNGKAIDLAKPAISDFVRRNNITGTVVVHVIIDERGNVVEAKAKSGPTALHPLSEAAALRSKFSATRHYGHLIKVSGVIEYHFEW